MANLSHNWITDKQNNCFDVELRFLSSLFYQAGKLDPLDDTMFLMLRPRHFTDERCRMAYTYFDDFYVKNKTYDFIKFYTETHANWSGIKFFFAHEDKANVTKSVLDYLASQIIKNSKDYNGWLKISELTNKMSLSGDSSDLISLRDHLNALEEDEGEELPFRTLRDVTADLVARIGKGEDVKEGIFDFSGLWPQLSQKTMVSKTELVVIGADTSMGKTAFACNMSMGLAQAGYNGLYFLYEGSAEQMVVRNTANKLKYDSRKIMKSSKMNKKDRDYLAAEMTDIAAQKESVGSFAYIEKAYDIEQLETFIMGYTRKHPLDFIVVDHLHAMPVRGDLRQGTIEITKRFMSIAVKYKIAIIALAQFRKDACTFDRVPTADDLRESSTIKQDAHHVWLLYDRGFLEEKQQQVDDSDIPNNTKPFHRRERKPAEVHVVKNREGEKDFKVLMEYKRPFHSWLEVTEQP